MASTSAMMRAAVSGDMPAGLSKWIKASKSEPRLAIGGSSLSPPHYVKIG